MIRFRVNGRPAPQGSKRHVGGGRMVESSRAVGPWREAVRADAVAEVCRMTRDDPDALAGFMYQALSVAVTFMLPRPTGHYRTGRCGGIRPSAPEFPATRPDVDKLARAVLDGLVMAGVMADDSQVISLAALKVYATKDAPPGALIEVEAI